MHWSSGHAAGNASPRNPATGLWRAVRRWWVGLWRMLRSIG